MSVAVGKVSVAVIPSFAGFQAALAEGMKPGQKVAEVEGAKAGEGYGKGFSKTSKETTGRTLPINVNKDEIRKSGEESGKKFGSGFSESTKTVLEGLGALAAFDFLKDAIKDGNELGRTMSILQAHLKSTSDAVGIDAEGIKKLAEHTAELTGNNTNAELSVANMLLVFNNVRGAIYQQALPAVNDISAAMGIGLPQAAKVLGKALNDPAQGMGALTRVGVQFSAQQKKQIKDWEATGQTAKAQALILAQVNLKMGGTAEAAAQPIQKLKAAWWNFTESIGEILIPTVNKLVVMLTTRVLPALEQTVQWVERNKTAVLSFVGVVGGLLVMIKTIQMVTAAMTALNAVMKANIWVLIAVGIAAVIVLLMKFHLLTPIFDALKTAWGYVVEGFRASLSFFEGAWGRLKAGFQAVAAVFTRGVNDVLSPFIRLKNFVVGSFDGWWASHGQQIKDIWNAAWIAVRAVWNAVGAPVFQAAAAVVRGFGQVFKLTFDVLRVVVSIGWGLISGIFRVQLAILHGLVNVAFAAMKLIVTVAFGAIRLVIKVAWDVIVAIFSIAIDLVTGKWGQAWRDIKAVGIQIWNAIKQFFGASFVQPMKQFAMSLVDFFLHDFWNPVSNFFTNTLPGAFKNSVASIKKFWGDLQNVVKAPVAFLVNTVYDNGIARIWNDTAGKVGMPSLPIEHFASGGVVSGRGTGDSVPAMLTPGEHVLSVPQVARLGGHDAIMAAAGGGVMGGMDRADGRRGFWPGGGVLGHIVGAAKRAAHDVAHPTDAIKDIRNLAGDAAGAVLREAYNTIVKPLIGRIPGAGSLSEALGKFPAAFIDKMVAAVKGHQDASGAGSFGSAHLPGNAAQWITQGLQIAGRGGDARWLAGISTIAANESGGNPDIVNTTDSNAKAGHPSAGLLQFIKSTFDAYAMPGYTNWMNPVHQVVADSWAKGYIVSRYGDINKVPGLVSLAAAGGHGAYRGYDDGGPLMPGVTIANNTSGRVEGVATHRGLSALADLNSGRMAAGDTYISVKVGETPLNDIVDARIERDNVESARMAEAGWVQI